MDVIRKLIALKRAYRLKKSVKRALLRSVLVLAGFGLIAWGGLQYAERSKVSEGPNLPPNLTQTVTASSIKPAENTVDIAQAGTVKLPSDQPKLLYIPRLGIKGLVQKVGIDTEGKIAVPTNINLAGWYVNSVRPGDKGLSIIDGHVSGIYNEAIFGELHRVKIGDRFAVEYGDGHTKKFEVVSVRTVPADVADEVVFAHDQTIPAQLNLVTCIGEFDKKADTFSDRLIVTAKTL